MPTKGIALRSSNGAPVIIIRAMNMQSQPAPRRNCHSRRNA